jgi:3-oxoacyl-[acyl-carrier protein] reductase
MSIYHLHCAEKNNWPRLIAASQLANSQNWVSLRRFYSPTFNRRNRIMDLQLKNKTALVTGASVGIGRGIAKALSAEGVRVAISARRKEKLEELAQEIVAAGGLQPVIIESDLYAEDAAAKLTAAAIQGLGHVDILVNNAGGSRSFKDLHVSEEAWQEAITLNFHRPRQVADALIDQMIARKWGRIINITGKSEPDHVNGAFCAKAGIHSWAKGLSRMVGPHGITVNCIPPGRIHSEQIFRNYTPEYRQWQCENEIPMGRYGEPEDMANLVTFLSSPLASYITGAVIPVDGGLRRYQF